MSPDTNRLAHDLEEMEDALDVALLKLARIENANAEKVPFALVKRLSAGAHPLIVWREYRGHDVVALAAASGIEAETIAAIEAGQEPSLRAALALARALRIDADDLLPWRQD